MPNADTLPSASALAARFVELLALSLTPDEWRLMRERNASPEYAGDCCASHDFLDANMTMLDAWHELADEAPAFLSDADEEAQSRDMRIWSEAWDLAKREHLTAPKTAAPSPIDAYARTCEPHFFRYEMALISACLADRYYVSGDNARLAFSRYDFLVWC